LRQQKTHVNPKNPQVGTFQKDMCLTQKGSEAELLYDDHI